MGLWYFSSVRVITYQLIVGIIFFIVSTTLLGNPKSRLPENVPKWIMRIYKILVIFFAGLYIIDELSLLYLYDRQPPEWFQFFDNIVDRPAIFWLIFTGSLLLLMEFSIAQTDNVEIYTKKPHEKLRSVIALLAIYGMVFNTTIFFWNELLTQYPQILSTLGLPSSFLLDSLINITIILGILFLYAKPFFASKGFNNIRLSSFESEKNKLINRIGFTSVFLILTETLISRVIFLITILRYITKSFNQKHNIFDANKLSILNGNLWYEIFSYYFMITYILPMLFYWFFFFRPYPPDASFYRYPFFVSIIFQIPLTIHVFIHLFKPKHWIYYISAIIFGVIAFYVLPILPSLTYLFSLNGDTDLMFSFNIIRPVTGFIHISFAIIATISLMVENFERKKTIYWKSSIILLYSLQIMALFIGPIIALSLFRYFPYIPSMSFLLTMLSLITGYAMASLNENNEFSKSVKDLIQSSSKEELTELSNEIPYLKAFKPVAKELGIKPLWWRFLWLTPIAFLTIPIGKLLG